MNKNRLDEKTLAALVMMSTDKTKGVKHNQFLKHDNMNEAINLVNGGYAEKIIIPKETGSYYRLTEKGIGYFNRIFEFASKEFG